VAQEEASEVGRSALGASGRMHWTLRRLHSLSGIVPIGGFLFFHMFENSYVMRGGETWWKQTAFTRTLPLQLPIEAAVLWIPIAYHALYGLVITVTSQPNNYSYVRNYQYNLQRITGVLAFLFIGFHVFSTRALFYLNGIDTDYARMHAFMINPIYFTIYIIGTLSCLYHLCNGIFTFCITWGLSSGPRSQTLVNYACVALFIVLAIVGLQILVAFRAAA